MIKSKKVLRFIILSLLLFISIIKYKKYQILNLENKFYKSLITLEDSIKIYNEYTISEIFNDKITIVNMYDVNDLKHLNNIYISKKIKEVFNNDINIVDILVENNNNLNNDEIFNLYEQKEEEFIKKNEIYRPVFSLSEDKIKKTFNINNPINKVIILNENGEIEYIENNNIDINKLSDILIKISKNKKIISSKKNILKNKIKQNDNNLIKSFSKFILIENLLDFDMPVLAIADIDKIFISKLSGEILYIIENKNICQITNIKYTNKDLYVVDACSSSIYKVDFKEKILRLFIKSEELFGISDFEFIEGNKLIISKKLNDGIGIFNLEDKKYNNITSALNLNYSIGEVEKIIKIRNEIYYLDSSSNILYLYENGKNEIILNLNNFEDITIYNKIVNFYMDSKKNIYFIEDLENKIIHYNNNKLKYIDIKNYLIKDLIIYKNIYYYLTDKNINQFAIYTLNNKNINIYFSNNTNNFFNINDILMNIKEYKEYKTKEKNIKLSKIFGDLNILPYSPSFLLILEKNNNQITPKKILHYNSFIDDEEIELNKEYMIFGKLYYMEDNEIKLKKINISLKYNKN